MNQILQWILVSVAVVVLIVVNIATAMALVWAIQSLGAPIDMSPESVLAVWILMSIAYYLFNSTRHAKQ